MLILNAAEVRRALPMNDVVDAMKRAFAALSGGRAIVPPRIHLPIERHAGISLFMPAFVEGRTSDYQALAVKAVSLFDGNPARGLARLQAAVMVFEPDTGRPSALLEGATLTALRTAAASGAATDLLARPDSRRLALFGAGVEARTHLEAMCAVRPIASVAIFSRTRAKVDALIEEFAARGDLKLPLRAATSPGDALRQADIVCATTTSRTPVFDDADLPEGAHVNAVGSYTPQAREIPPETVRRATVVVDSRAATWEEAGDLIQPLQAGLITRDHIRAELGELVLGNHPGRTTPAEITFFKSVGIAAQDAAAAQLAVANARRMGLGVEVEWE